MSHVSRLKIYTLVSMFSFAIGVLALQAGVSGVSAFRRGYFFLFFCHQFIPLFIRS